MATDGIGRPAKIADVFSRVAITGSEVSGHVYLKPIAQPEAGTTKGRVYFDSTTNGLEQSDGTRYRAISDRHLVRIDIDANSVDANVFIADRGYKVIAIQEVHSVVGGASAAVRPRKVTGTAAPGASAGTTVKELTTANIDLTATINTVQAAALTSTAADLTLAAGDRIALDFSGTLTGLVGVVQIVLEQA